jgi:biotin-(acetyl-CoA carboxylase) ligase
MIRWRRKRVSAIIHGIGVNVRMRPSRMPSARERPARRLRGRLRAAINRQADREVRERLAAFAEGMTPKTAQIFVRKNG